mmetsp:Transcript_40387/g.84371  ORF Transcript_40387/g.84371 Transcript_40387/m.84371 type:complete len:92 (+) Transcript_40387:3728-4003(+)
MTSLCNKMCLLILHYICSLYVRTLRKTSSFMASLGLMVVELYGNTLQGLPIEPQRSSVPATNVSTSVGFIMLRGSLDSALTIESLQSNFTM